MKRWAEFSTTTTGGPLRRPAEFWHTTGTSNGIGASSASTGLRVSIRNGSIRGFSASCVLLNANGYVADLTVGSCGERGLDVGVGSVVLSNRVGNTGAEGLRQGSDSTFAHNVFIGSGLSGGSTRAVSGGTPSAGNVCHDGSCTAKGERRYYLTPPSINGANATNPGNCVAGFHFASLWEIFDISSLRYDASLGVVMDDSGQGPPQTPGWIRTGADSFSSAGAGEANCSNWTSAAQGDAGTGASLAVVWDDPAVKPSPWYAFAASCQSAPGIWCVGD